MRPRKAVTCWIRQDAADALALVAAESGWSPGQMAAEVLTLLADCPPSHLMAAFGVLERAVKEMVPMTPIIDNPMPRVAQTREQRAAAIDEARLRMYIESRKKHEAERAIIERHPYGATVSLGPDTIPATPAPPERVPLESRTYRHGY